MEALALRSSCPFKSLWRRIPCICFVKHSHLEHKSPGNVMLIQSVVHLNKLNLTAPYPMLGVSNNTANFLLSGLMVFE